MTTVFVQKSCGLKYPVGQQSFSKLVGSAVQERALWLKEFGISVTFGGILSTDKTDNPLSFAENVAKTLAARQGANDKILCIGSDHWLSAGTVQGVAAKAPVGLIHIDAHADLEDYHSERCHGAYLSYLIERYQSGGLGGVDPSHIIQVGVRDFSHRELARLSRLRKVFASIELEDLHFVNRLQDEITHLKQEVRCFYVSCDLDVVDPGLFPAVNTPKAGGISLNKLSCIVGMLLDDAACVGLDLVEYAPTKDYDGRCLEALNFLMGEALGYQRALTGEYRGMRPMINTFSL